MNTEKIKKFIKGHCGLLKKIESECSGAGDMVWVHAASYGEFEEARPIIEAIRKDWPQVKILATFFSPSGYEHLKNDPVADFVYYLPLATRCNARRFLNAVQPVRVVISISDYWLPYLHELRRRKIRTYLTSARFEDGMFYFRKLGKTYLNAFKTCFTRIIVRDEKSLEILQRHGVTNAVLSGDPRIDRVLSIADSEWHDEKVERWLGNGRCFVGGSILPDEDETVISDLANAHPQDKFLIVPHEIEPAAVNHLRDRIKQKSALYTEDGGADAQVLIVDTVGLLSRLYRYGFAAYVGAGFDGAPHSIVEPAAYGIPVSYGPQFGSHYHCQYLIDCGGGHAIHDSAELVGWYDTLKAEPERLAISGEAARQYCLDRCNVAEGVAHEIMA